MPVNNLPRIVMHHGRKGNPKLIDHKSQHHLTTSSKAKQKTENSD